LNGGSGSGARLGHSRRERPAKRQGNLFDLLAGAAADPCPGFRKLLSATSSPLGAILATAPEGRSWADYPPNEKPETEKELVGSSTSPNHTLKQLLGPMRLLTPIGLATWGAGRTRPAWSVVAMVAETAAPEPPPRGDSDPVLQLEDLSGSVPRSGGVPRKLCRLADQTDGGCPACCSGPLVEPAGTTVCS